MDITVGSRRTLHWGGFSRSEPFVLTVGLHHNGPALKGGTCDLRSGLVIRQDKPHDESFVSFPSKS